MKRLTIISLAILLLAPVRPCFGQEASDVSADYDGAWNTPTIRHSNANSGYTAFGFMDASDIPPIPGLKYRSCTIPDNSDGLRAILALRCPPLPGLLQWMSGRVRTWSLFDREKLPAMPVFESSAQIRAFFIGQAGRIFRGMPDLDTLSKPRWGLLIADCWKTGRLYTFYENSWYFNGASMPVRPWDCYFTVDAETGTQLTLKDFIAEEHWDRLARIQMKYLRTRWDEPFTEEHWLDPNLGLTPRKILDGIAGCALIREGLILYYYQFTTFPDMPLRAVIPYDEIEDILLIEKKN